MKRIILLGSTGSIGRQTIEVARRHPDRCQIVALAAHRNLEVLGEQCRSLDPERIALTGCSRADLLGSSVPQDRAILGPEALSELVATTDCDIVVNAVTGAAGLAANLVAVDLGRRLAIANKESLVMAGPFLLRRAREAGAEVLPVDSEHSAIYQCLAAGRRDEVRRVVLTASGGPFRTRPVADLAKVTIAEALAHPTWNMGPKISVDSATLMNKALEIIEANVLFDLPADKIDVVVHPESVVHSMVEFHDGSTVAHLGPPDMRVPIQFALSHPERWTGSPERVDWPAIGNLTFERADPAKFPSLDLAYRCCQSADSARIVLNAANEVAVEAFLAGRIGFTDIFTCVERALEADPARPVEDLDEVMTIDRHTRESVAGWTS